MEIMFLCLGGGCFLVCLSLSYKIFSETKIKKIAFHKSFEEVIKSHTHSKNNHHSYVDGDHTAEDLMKRLDEFRNAKFARKMPVSNKNNHRSE
jgi:hypothetical protein